MTDPLRNPKDPLRKSGPEAEHALFRAFGQAANGFPREVVVGAAMNMLINVIRQSHSNMISASNAYDEVTQKFKGLLLDNHYDGLGNRKNIFPFTQTINVDLLRNKNSFFEV